MLGAAVRERAREESAESAFCRLVSAEIDGAYRLAGYLLGGATDAEDATQDAIAKAWSSFDTLRDPDLFDRWFRRILVNTCRDRMRRSRRVRWLPIDDPDAEIEGTDPFATSLARDALGRALGVLSEDERTIVILHYWNDLSTADVGDLLRIPQGTVKYRLHSAYSTLRRALDEQSKEAGR